MIWEREMECGVDSEIVFVRIVNDVSSDFILSEQIPED